MAETKSVGDYEIINDCAYCSDECRYLELDQTDGWCLLLNKELNFYDWFLAECDPEFYGHCTQD